MKLIDLANNEHALLPDKVVATVGFFDGVHVGHQHLIEQVKAEAAQRGLPSAVITFPVHPRKVLNAEYKPKLLDGYQEKIDRLGTTGIDYVISLPFTVELSQLSAQEFLTQVLHQTIHVDTLLIGYDHRFGRDREDGFEDYKRYGAVVGMSVLEATEYRWYERNVSSSVVRRLLMDGDIVTANKLLTYNYTMTGKIVEGYQVGRTIGFPTANMKIWERYKVVPLLGVYAVFVHYEGERFEGMLYVGKRPTLHNDPSVSIEVNLFDFDGDLYNRTLTVEFIDFIRGDEKFVNVEKLVASINRDKELVLARLKQEKEKE